MGLAQEQLFAPYTMWGKAHQTKSVADGGSGVLGCKEKNGSAWARVIAGLILTGYTVGFVVRQL